MSKSGMRQPLIVTAADHRFARSLMQFLRSAERHGEHRRLKWIVYDLGLSPADRDILSRAFPWASVRPVNFAGFPPHVNVATGSFAWKPILFNAAARDHDGPVFWFDSATVFRRALREPIQSVVETGFWTLKGQTPLMGRADPRVIAALNVPPEVLHLPERVAGAVGFDTRNPVADGLLQEWARLAHDPRYILPDGPDQGHRFDQTLLSSLLLTKFHKGEIVLGEEEVDISSIRPVTYLTTRNKLWPSWPLWLDAPGRAWYHLWKASDRAWHRLRILDDTRIDGWKRRKRDHFSVKLRHLADNREVTIPTPADGYYADPFITHHDGRDWLFVEEFVYSADRGFLSVLELDEEFSVASARPVEFTPDYVALDSHASFPCLLEADGATYMIPETHERRVVDLFACEAWPNRWHLVRRLLHGVDAADSMLIRDQGLWYLITSVQGPCQNRHLEIFFTGDLLSGDLVPHPVNAERRYGDDKNGTGRNAGYIGRQGDGTLVRLMQHSPNYYGEGVRPMRISKLTPTEFAEEPIAAIDFLPGITAGVRTHHASRCGNILAFDTRDRVG